MSASWWVCSISKPIARSLSITVLFPKKWPENDKSIYCIWLKFRLRNLSTHWRCLIGRFLYFLPKRNYVNKQYSLYVSSQEKKLTIWQWNNIGTFVQNCLQSQNCPQLKQNRTYIEKHFFSFVYSCLPREIFDMFNRDGPVLNYNQIHVIICYTKKTND